MVTQTPNQLNHEEAFELLPWHINSTLEEPLSELVADHVEQCASCREESAILSNTIVALNSSDEVSTNLDGRFSNLLGRVREYERTLDAATPRIPVGQRIAAWLGISPVRLQWAGAFTLGLIVGVSALLVTLQSNDLNPDTVPEYVTHGAEPQPLLLRVNFGAVPSAEILSELQSASGMGAGWQQQSDTEFLVELPEMTTVETVARIRTRLLAHEMVTAVAVDVDATKSE